MTRSRRIRLPIMTALLACVVPIAAPTRAALLAQWTFDGCSAQDVAHGHDLALGGGPTCTAGVLGTAWALDGGNQYLEGSGTDFGPGLRAWTVSAWVRSAGDTLKPGVIASWYRCGANPLCNSTDGALWALWDRQGHAAFNVRDDSIHDFELTDSSVALADGRWHFVVGTLSAAHDTLRLYVDGVQRKVRDVDYTTISGSPPLEIGRWYRTGWGTPDYYYKGTIDEVRVYDEELGPASIVALYAAGTASASTGPAEGLALARIAPNPTRASGFRVEFTSSGTGSVRILLLDVSGRRVREQVLAAVPPGRHEVRLGDAALAPGLYLVRVTQGAASVSRRVSVMR
ncbi:MAG: LamG-like jellyroll fold domain-containing protein [Candidatus Eisenbacteria bacterium]